MTLIDDSRQTADRTEQSTETSAPGLGAGSVRVVPLRRVLVSAVAVVAILTLSFLLVEVPVGHVWYSARQGERNSGMNQKREATKVGQTLAVLQIPTIGLDEAVVEGDSPSLLRGGPGHAPTSPVPGKIGNSVIFGHDKGWGGPLARLKSLRDGDVIYLKVHGEANALAFQVVNVQTVTVDSKYLVPSNDHRLTLITGDKGSFFGGGYTVVSAVSGSTGALQKGPPIANPRSGSLLFTKDTLLLALRIVAAVVVIGLLRRRYRPGVVIVLASPLVLSAALALLLTFDLLVPPLR